MLSKKYLPALSIALVATGFSFLNTAQSANAAALRTGFSTHSLGPTDDGSTGAVWLGFELDFFGRSFNQTYVNNNGNITFDGPLNNPTPFNFTNATRAIIAPFFADVDTRNQAPQYNPGVVQYGIGSIDGRKAFGATYDRVGFFNLRPDKLNSFQVVLIERFDTGTGNFDIEFNYNQIEWETGNFHGGRNGLGGNSARVGYSNGTRADGTFFELSGSAFNGAFLDSNTQTGLIHRSLNSDVKGRYIFQVRNGNHQEINPIETVPEPSTIFGTVIFGSFFGRLWFKRKRQEKN